MRRATHHNNTYTKQAMSLFPVLNIHIYVVIHTISGYRKTLIPFHKSHRHRLPHKLNFFFLPFRRTISMSLRGNTYVNKGKNRFCYIASLYTQHTSFTIFYYKLRVTQIFTWCCYLFCGNFRF